MDHNTVDNNVGAIVRQLNIDIITDTPNPIVEWFNDIWSRLYIIETNVFHKNGKEFIYYIIDDDKKRGFFFFQDNKNDKFWCDYDKYWSVLTSKFSLNYHDIQMVTKLLVENALNNSVATPPPRKGYFARLVENVLNNSVATPVESDIYSNWKVENVLNNSVTTPGIDLCYELHLVENVLNNSVATPLKVYRNHNFQVENALNNSINDVISPPSGM